MEMERRDFVKLVGCLFASVPLFGIAGCSSSGAGSANTADTGEGAEWLKSDPQTSTLFVFDTIVTLSAYCPESLMSQAVDRCNYFENKFSRTIEGSDIWNVNNAGGQPVQVASETADLVSKSLEYCKRSGGLFDITIGSVSSLWDFDKGVKPSDKSIKEAIGHIDYTGVHVNGDTITMDDPKAMIDLGGTAKGYIADDLARLFSDGGCLSALINLGGNVYVLGSKPDGSEWKVGIQDPNKTEGSVIASVEAKDCSVVTSGLYERKFKAADGKTYYHILDPKTGYPVKTDLVSSSVLSSSSLDGDAYATWMFLLGHEKALSLIQDTDGLEGMVVNAKGKVTQSKGASFRLAKE